MAKDKLKTGLEYDVICSRKLHKYLKNNYKLVKFAKNQINKRRRKVGKHFIKNMTKVIS